MEGTTLAVLTFVVTLYILVGGAVFYGLEGVHEHDLKLNTSLMYAAFQLSVNACITGPEVEAFVVRILEARGHGVYAAGHGKNFISWNFDKSVFFSMTAITTIGYGNQVPVTREGRFFLCVYAIIGIPMIGLLISGLGKKIGEFIKPLQNETIIKKNAKLDKAVKSLLIIGAGLLIFVFFPAVLFSFMEEWTYLEGFYYCIVTLTTIGFGDFVLGFGKTRLFYRLVSSVWILFGLSWIAMVLGNLQEIYNNLSTQVDTKLHLKSSPEKTDEQPEQRTTDESNDNVDTNDNAEGVPDDG